jgi:hypothetical protein
MNVKGLLVTGPEASLQEFHLRVAMLLNGIDRRGQTGRYACMAEDLETALAAARNAGVTVQEIVVTGRGRPRTHDLGGGASVTVTDNVETYPVLYLAPHGMKWEAKEKKARRPGRSL